MSKLIIVCGLPGSGKTTLAKALASDLNVACFHKDEIKEHLYDHFVGEGLEDSKKYGLAAVSLLFHLTEAHLERGVDIMIESPFYVEDDWKMFESWQEKYGFDLTTILCDADLEERARRLQSRERHRAHHDVDPLLCSQDHPSCRFDYDVYTSNYIRVVTNRPVEELVEEVKKQLN